MMLVYQGAIALEIWTGRKAPVDVMEEAVRASLRGGEGSRG
jgi:shikimate dehydrogenase